MTGETLGPGPVLVEEAPLLGLGFSVIVVVITALEYIALSLSVYKLMSYIICLCCYYAYFNHLNDKAEIVSL